MKKVTVILLALVMLLSCMTAFAETDPVKLTFQRIGSDAAESAYPVRSPAEPDALWDILD